MANKQRSRADPQSAHSPSLHSRSYAGTVYLSGRVHGRADRPDPEGHLQTLRDHRDVAKREATG